MRTVTSFCRICESLCGIAVDVDDDDKIVRIRGDEDHPVSKGYLCPKGSAMAKVVDDPDRVLSPLRRRAGGAPGEFEPVSWNEALDDIAARLERLRDERGPDSIGVYMGNPNVFSTGSVLWTKRFIKALDTPHFYQSGPHDTFGRHTVSGYLYGSVMAFLMPDIPRTEFLLMLGANPLVSQGSLISLPGIRGELNDVVARGGRIVVVDPVRTRTAEAYEHLAIRPGTDAWLAGALLNVIFGEGLADRDTATSQAVGLDQLEHAVSRITPDLAADITGIDAESIRRLARDFAGAGRAVAYSRVGLNRNPNGTVAIALVDALNVVTGNYDRPGGWIFGDPPIDFIEIGAQMGMDTVGNKHHTRIGNLPDIGGMLPWVLVEEMKTPGDGQVRAFFTVAGNPVLSAPGGDDFEQALEELDLLVSLDLYVTETSRHADYILPATTFLERPDGYTAFMGTMPRPWIQTTQAVVEAPPEVRDDWKILDQILERMGLSDGQTTPHDVLDDLLKMVQSEFTMEELSHHPHGIKLADEVPTGTGSSNVQHPDGKVHLDEPALLDAIASLPDRGLPASPERPLRLVGRRELRSINSWMHNVRTSVKGGPTLWLSAADATTYGLVDGDDAVVEGPAGSIQVAVEVTDRVEPGTVSYPHGWGHQGGGWRTANAIGGANVNAIASTALADKDPLSGASHLDGFAVALRPVANMPVP